MKYSKKGLEKRKADREGYAEFFQKHIQIIKNNKCLCEECGDKLIGHVSEIAHVLPKSYFKSLATNDDNVIYLCGMYTLSQCHTNFDNQPVEKVKQMIIYPKVMRIFAELESTITEKITYKHYEKYGES